MPRKKKTKLNLPPKLIGRYYGVLRDAMERNDVPGELQSSFSVAYHRYLDGKSVTPLQMERVRMIVKECRLRDRAAKL